MFNTNQHRLPAVEWLTRRKLNIEIQMNSKMQIVTMNCIFDNFNKRKATPFLEPHRNDPKKFMFPSTSQVAQAAAHAQGKPLWGTSGSLFSSTGTRDTLFGTTGQPQEQFHIPAHRQFQPLFPLPDQFNVPLHNSQPFLNLTSSELFQTSIRLTRCTSKVSMGKVLAILSSELYANGANLTTVTKLNPKCDSKDVTQVAPFAIAAFVDANVLESSTRLCKIHVQFLQELIQETVKTVDEMWKCALNLTSKHGLSVLLPYITTAQIHKTLTIQKEHITPEVAFVLALHAFITNDDHPHDALKDASKYQSKIVLKLTSDMCMASYGLNWILDVQTQDYIEKHQNTYVLSI